MRHFFSILLLTAAFTALQAQKATDKPAGDYYGWLNTARIFLIDAYQPPFAPKLEFDAEKLAQTMQEMHVNVVRMSTMGKYATIQGIRYPVHPDQGKRDLLAEMIAAAKPRGIKVLPYISTGHKLAWSTVTKYYPDYAQITEPGGGPALDHMYLGEEMGAICWNTSYRQAYYDYITHVIRDYDVTGMYFDSWTPFYFWPGRQVCYCNGCTEGFKKATGLDLPWHKDDKDYTAEDEKTIDKYHSWYKEEFIGIMKEVRRIIKSYKDVPLIYNINDPEKILGEDPRVIASMDAFLYERGESMLERAEGVSLARTMGLRIMPYIAGYDNWPRVVNNMLDIQQEIYTTMMFGGAPIISQPYPYIYGNTNREFVSRPFALMSENEGLLGSVKNVPFAVVIYASSDPEGHAKKSWWWRADTRSATLGAFAACLYDHIQVSSAMPALLDDPEKLASFRVVYLADNVSLTEKEISNLKQYVSNGGGLIASYSTSLYDNNGKRRSDFGLSDLIKVKSIKLPAPLENYQAMIGGPNDLYYLKRKDASFPGNSWNDVLVPAWYYEPVEVLSGGSVVMDIVTGDGRRPVLPGLVLSSYGKGKVLYSASSLESLFYSNGNPELRKLISEMVSAVSPGPLPYSVKAPSALIANLTTTGKKNLLHLTNWTGDKFEMKHVMEDYIAPVNYVEITIPVPAGTRVESVRSLTGSPFTKETGKESLKITIPRVEAYEGIEITYDK
jgi:hypothetical protein